MIVLDKGCFALAVVAQLVDRDAHSSQGFPDPRDVELEDSRNLFPWSRELGIDVRHGESCRERIRFAIGDQNRYNVEEVDFPETTGA